MKEEEYQELLQILRTEMQEEIDLIIKKNQEKEIELKNHFKEFKE
jgi:hypothetical protein